MKIQDIKVGATIWRNFLQGHGKDAFWTKISYKITAVEGTKVKATETTLFPSGPVTGNLDLTLRFFTDLSPLCWKVA